LIDRLPYGARHQIPTLIVVHAMAEFIEINKITYHAVDFLRKVRLSAHRFITPSGTNIESRRDDQGAYHAKGFNKNSLGIEILVEGQHDYRSFVDTIKTDWCKGLQMEAAISQVRQWMILHAITDIKKHSELSPERKVDPGEGFNWDYFIKHL